MTLPRGWGYVATAVTSALLEAAEPDAVVRIGTHEQLFLDDHVISRIEGITRRVTPATKRVSPVIEPDKSWEHNSAVLFGTVIHDEEEGLYKAWYHAGGHVGYATSRDGLRWDKPELDVVLQDGLPSNLVVARGSFGYFYELFGVLKDRVDPDPNRRYKMAFVSIQREYDGTYPGQFHRGQRRGLGTAISPDGLHWTLENNFASTDICDIGRFYQNPDDGKYILFGRTKITPESDDGTWRVCGWGRAVNYLESRDFRTWTPGELVLAADSRDPDGTEIYSVSAFPYEGVTIGLVQMLYDLPDQGNLDMQLAISRDGRHFIRVQPRTPFIPEGPIGSWDRYNISVGCLPPVEVGDEFRFYYGGRTYRHSPHSRGDDGPKGGRIGVATVKRGRFLALEASFAGGTVLTKPLLVQGERLYLNANTTYGRIDLSLQHPDGAEISRTTVRNTDATAIDAGFGTGDLAALRGKAARLEFSLHNAHLYGFRIGD